MKRITVLILTIANVLMFSACAIATPISISIVQGDINAVSRDINESNINSSEDASGTPLTIALLFNKSEIAKLLIERGANVNLPNPAGQAPLHLAVQTNNIAMVKLLLEKGANVDGLDKLGSSALTNSAGLPFVDISISRMLIEKGANVNLVNSPGLTPLVLACLRGKILLARLLIDKGADINFETKEGITPLSAAAKDNVELINLLIAKGANASYRNKAGRNISEQRSYIEQLQKPPK